MTLGSSQHESPPGSSTWTTTRLSQRTLSTPQSVARWPKFCDRIYTFFRWAVTDTFLDEYGAER